MELSPCKLGHDEAAVRAGASCRTQTRVDRTKQLAPARIKADSQVVHWVGTIKCSVATQAQTLDPTASASVGVAVSEGGFSCLCWCWGTAQSCVACIPSLLGNLVGIWSTTSLIEAAYAPNLKLEASSGSSLCRHPWTACCSLLCSCAPLASNPRRSPALALMARANREGLVCSGKESSQPLHDIAGALPPKIFSCPSSETCSSESLFSLGQHRAVVEALLLVLLLLLLPRLCLLTDAACYDSADTDAVAPHCIPVSKFECSARCRLI